MSVVIPIYNEQRRIEPLIERLSLSLGNIGIACELLFVDDNSTDGSYELATLEKNQFQGEFSIQVHRKVGKKGKGFSLEEGFAHAKHDLICFIDGNGQYPAEAIPGMLQQLRYPQVGMVVADRIGSQRKLRRQIPSLIFRSVFGHFLHRLDCDIQSGLKLFRKEIISGVTLHPTKWAIDLELLLVTRSKGYQIRSHPIEFQERRIGKSNVQVFPTSVELAKNALSLWFRFLIKERKIVAKLARA